MKPMIVGVVFAACIGLARAADIPGADHRFVMMASQAAAAELAEAQLALERSSRSDVREFARRVIVDHSKASDHLNRVALAQSLPLAEQPTAADRRYIAKLSELSGDAFDRAYIDNATANRMAAVRLYSEELEAGRIPELRSFAKSALPTLRAHVRMVTELPE